ncbi:MAG: HAD-IIIA family hydrolase [Clostridiales bacterium]|jgi:D-glycero-D-manno-heptose 1,7-bisphosphate phosphatase|nr:HAD-IIIA family hydrolase [Clostridiales bacterium]
MKAVIMAGGKGARISSVASDIPKSMIDIGGKPVLEHEIACLKNNGITDIIITISHLGHIIKEYFGDGKRFGVNIDYYYEETPIGNAAALFHLKDRLAEDFLLINGDILFDINITKFMEFHKSRDGFVTLFTHPNSHPYDSGLIAMDSDGRVTDWLTKEDNRPLYYKNRVNAGIHIVSPRLLDMDALSPKVDLDRQLLKPLAGTGKMYAYDSPEYVKDMGTPERYEQVKRDFLSGKIGARNLRRKQKAIFLDRDGTVNKYVGFLRNMDEFELLFGVADAIRSVNESDYLAIIITNQPVIARGEVTVDELQAIHNKMETLLGNEGAYLDGIYYCPHHLDKGFAGEAPELKVYCDCRKPKPGLLLQAASAFNIDLSRSWMIGDRESDAAAGQAAGCQTLKISEGANPGAEASLLAAVEKILGGAQCQKA